jgi:hypothetical protein
MVTSPHSLASSVGVDVLRAGGSAIDAAIAASAVLAVIYPHMTGLGGDAFWLVHDGGSGEIKYLNGGGKAAAGASLASMEGRGLSEIPLRGIVPATLTVPGGVASARSRDRLCARRLSGFGAVGEFCRDDAWRSRPAKRSSGVVLARWRGTVTGHEADQSRSGEHA